MAKKGQRFLNYTEEEKNEIIQKYCSGETSGYQLAKQYGIYGFSIYYYWFNRHRLM